MYFVSENVVPPNLACVILVSFWQLFNSSNFSMQLISSVFSTKKNSSVPFHVYEQILATHFSIIPKECTQIHNLVGVRSLQFATWEKIRWTHNGSI
jgi:hypothetical protein